MTQVASKLIRHYKTTYTEESVHTFSCAWRLMTRLLVLQNHKAHFTIHHNSVLYVISFNANSSLTKKTPGFSNLFPVIIYHKLWAVAFYFKWKGRDANFIDIILILLQDYCSRVFINLDNLKSNFPFRYIRYINIYVLYWQMILITKWVSLFLASAL